MRAAPFVLHIFSMRIQVYLLSQSQTTTGKMLEMSTGKWQSLSLPRTRFGAASLNGKLYIAGGDDGSDSDDEEEAFLASWVNQPPRLGGTLQTEALLKEVALRVRCLVVRCDAVLKVRRALRQAAGEEQHVAMERIVKGLTDIEAADGELFHAAHKDTGVQFDLNPSLGVEELHSLQDRVGETVSRSAIVADLGAAVAACDEARVLQVLEALELALGGDTIAAANGTLGSEADEQSLSPGPMSRTMQLKTTPRTPGARSPRAVRDAAMMLTMSVTSPQAALRKTPGSRPKPTGGATAPHRVLTAEQIATVDRARMYLDACTDARQVTTLRELHF